MKLLERDGVIDSTKPVGMVRELSNNISIRNGKFGNYIFYKNAKMKNGEPNPMLPFADDGFLFISTPDFTAIEILIITNGRYLIQGYLKMLANGAYNEALKAMREQVSISDKVYNESGAKCTTGTGDDL